MKNESLIISNHPVSSRWSIPGRRQRGPSAFSNGGRDKREIGLRYLQYILPILMFLTFIACEDQFIPVQENERHFFSVNGFLDASADTQWIRVMPVRETLIQESGLPVPTVTLQHTGSGENTVMRDSLFDFPDGKYAYNYWTTMSVEPEQNYRLTVEGEEGRSSYAEATLPKDFPLPQFRKPEFGDDILLIQQVEKLADVQVVYRIILDNSGEEFKAAFPYLPFSKFISPSTYRIPINPDFPRVQIRESYCGITVRERNIFVASGGPEWLDFLSLDKHTIALPDGVSNIENGVGYFGGIISKTFPYINYEGEHGLFNVQCSS